MKTWLWRGIQLALLGGLIALAIRNVDFGPLTQVRIDHAIPLLVVVVIPLIIRAYLLKVALSPTGVSLDHVEWFGLGIYATLLNLFMPLRSGVAVKGLYLKSVHGLGYREFAGLQAGLSFLQVFVAAAAGLLLLSVWLHAWLPLAAVLVATFLSIFGLRSLGRVSTDRRSGAMRSLAIVYNEFLSQIRHERLWYLLLLILLNLPVMALAFAMALDAVGETGSFMDAMLIVAAITLMSVVSLTPGNLGIQEFLAAYLSQAVGMDFNAGFLAMLVIRVFTVASLILCSPLILVIHSRWKK